MEGDKKSQLIQSAMAYQISKEIGAAAAVLKGKADAILLTGGIAHNTAITGYIKESVSFIAPVFIYPGEDEMKALALNGFMVQKGTIKPKQYDSGIFVKDLNWSSMD